MKVQEFEEKQTSVVDSSCIIDIIAWSTVLQFVSKDGFKVF